MTYIKDKQNRKKNLEFSYTIIFIRIFKLYSLCGAWLKIFLFFFKELFAGCLRSEENNIFEAFKSLICALITDTFIQSSQFV